MEEFRGLSYLNGSNLHPTQSFRYWLPRTSKEQETIEQNDMVHGDKRASLNRIYSDF